MPEKEEGQLVGDFPFIPKQDRAHKKRDALLESGKYLFIKKGYDQTTAKDIASYAGVATGTFYRYFEDKRQLLMSLLEDQLEKLMPPEPDWTSGNPQELLAALLENHYKRLEEVGIHCVLPELLPKDPELAQVLLKARRKLHSRILASLEQAKEKEETWADLDLDTVTWTILILVENGPHKEAQTGNPVDYFEMAKVICRIVFPPK
jgi:TetR/AcrR family transcriptional regulator, mexJK operon transcriptional repressor